MKSSHLLFLLAAAIGGFGIGYIASNAEFTKQVGNTGDMYIVKYNLIDQTAKVWHNDEQMQSIYSWFEVVTEDDARAVVHILLAGRTLTGLQVEHYETALKQLASKVTKEDLQNFSKDNSLQTYIMDVNKNSEDLPLSYAEITVEF